MGLHWFEHLQEQKGALHIHTVKSDGAGTLGEVVSAAERAGLDFLILTDHETRGYAEEGAEGWHGKVLVLVGEEVSIGSGRFLVLGHQSKIKANGDLNHDLREIRDQGGITIALPPEDETSYLPNRSRKSPEPLDSQVDTPLVSEAAPHPEKPPIRKWDSDPWPTDLINGWEFWCGLEDWARGRADRKPMTDPFTRVEHVGLSGPRRGAVRIWDYLTKNSRIYGFGGLNAHGRSWVSTSPEASLPYETLFRSLTTHILSPDLPRADPEQARSLLVESLRNGHFHTAQSCIAEPTGFRFSAGVPGQLFLLEGDQASFHPLTRIHVSLPRSAQLKLIHNGSLLLCAEDSALEVPVVGPGAYRVEAWLDRRPWIYSNPIWLMQPTPEEEKNAQEDLQNRMLEDVRASYSDILDFAT